MPPDVDPPATVAATDSPSAGIRERLAQAAFDQFSSHGFDATTIDEIAEAAGVSRRTFFRYFSTKEDVVFPEHERLREAVAADLVRRDDEPPLDAVCKAVSIVLDDYVEHRDAALLRFALTRSVTALRDREITSVHRYQQLFIRHLRQHLPDRDELAIELMAAAVVTAHNNVLRTWLQSGGTIDPVAELDAAFAQVRRIFASDEDRADSVVAVFSSNIPTPELIEAIRRQTEQAG